MLYNHKKKVEQTDARSDRIADDYRAWRLQQYGFPGLKPGDGWCLCASRWQEAFEAGCAPKVALEATHIGALDHCALQDLQGHAAQR